MHPRAGQRADRGRIRGWFRQVHENEKPTVQHTPARSTTAAGALLGLAPDIQERILLGELHLPPRRLRPEVQTLDREEQRRGAESIRPRGRR